MSENVAVATLCRVVEVSRSGYYHWKMSRTNERRDCEKQLAQRVRKLTEDKRYKCYGSRRLKQLLGDLGVMISRKCLRRIMKQYALKAYRKQTYRPKTTDSALTRPVAANLLERNFTADKPNQKWAGDITYLRCGSRFCLPGRYNGSVLTQDYWMVAQLKSLDTMLVVDALHMALYMRGKPKGVLFTPIVAVSMPVLRTLSCCVSTI